ncbi:MAG: PPK2 family polyphosphate kinase [Spirosomataceae bacterium]
MKINIDEFEHTGKKKFDIKDVPTKVKDLYVSEEDYLTQLSTIRTEIDKYQSLMFADKRYAMLNIFQALDAAGKDGTIKAVYAGVNPAGVVVHGFNRPTTQELSHDFMWRNMMKMPERGQIAVHNRSYYEEVLVVKVHPSILLEGQSIPKEFTKNVDKVWEERYEDIRNYESYLHRNGTVIMKFFLHVSKEEQGNRLIERIKDPKKNWKFDKQDVVERGHWKEYHKAYEELINETAKENAPWYVIPADDKKNMRLIISSLILEKMKTLKMDYPKLSPEEQAELQKLLPIIEEQNS